MHPSRYWLLIFGEILRKITDGSRLRASAARPIAHSLVEPAQILARKGTANSWQNAAEIQTGASPNRSVR
ncbi:MAG: hypothetical protein ACYCPD_05255, partial [Acidobacteriaceae bacterium]